MGISEVDKSSKEAKESNEPKTAAAPDPTSTAPGAFAADWSGFQAYSPMPPPPGFIASNPQAHPYMWGVQQFIPPYGTPLHPYVMYPHGSLYGHPTMAPGSYPFSPFVVPSTNGIGEASNNSAGNLEVVGKSSEAKGKLPIKRSKGSLGSLNMITWKNNEHGKSSGAIPNGLHSKSIESANEGSSEGSDANSKNGSQVKCGGQLDSEESSGEGNTDRSSQNGGRNTAQPMVNQAALVPVSAVGAVSGVPGPTTNLNIGMDYWGVDPSPPVPAAVMRGKMPAAAPIGSRDNIQPQLWIQDERELKRQRRKQSNRESARRSRLRKQAECDELAQRAEVLKEENASLREEVSRIRSEYEQLFSQNASLKARLDELPGESCSRSSNNDGQ